MKYLYLLLLTALVLVSCKSQIIETKCLVANKGFTASTLKQQGVPIISSNGTVSIAVAQTGETAKHLVYLSCDDGQEYIFDSPKTWRKVKTNQEYRFRILIHWLWGEWVEVI